MKEKKYVALVGIDFEGLKGKPRVEIGDLIPDEVPTATIKELLQAGDIKEATK